MTKPMTKPMTNTMTKPLALAFSILFTAARPSGAQVEAPPSDLPQVTRLIASPPSRQQGRVPFRMDDVQLQIARGTFEPPREPGGTWTLLEPGAEGWFSDQALAGGYAAARVESAEARTLLLAAAGHSMVYVNGEPRMGDVYSNDTTRTPVRLVKGENTLLFVGARGRMRVRFEKPPAPIFVQTLDPTLPDAVRGQKLGTTEHPTYAGIIVTNTTEQATSPDLMIETAVGDGPFSNSMSVGVVQPFSSRKVAAMVESTTPIGPEERVKLRVRLRLGESVRHEATFELEAKNADQARRETFISNIDGSVQYYGYLAPTPRDQTASDASTPPGMILSLHGASVEGISQARAYKPKPWAHIVTPTNRRPFGFDWEDWGRKDGIEVLERAQERYQPDPRRVWLTGHSMGGHGTWHFGVTFPDRFAAIAPSAGWISFWTYAGGPRFGADGSGVLGTLRDATNPSDTLALVRNLENKGVYILHGDADDNVPVGQARQMRTVLGEFHTDFAYYERPGAGHWWGDECLDWPALTEFFRARARPERVDRIDFRMFHPGVSARCDWASVQQQQTPGVLSRVELVLDRKAGTIKGTTTNVRRLTLDLAVAGLDGPAGVELDGSGALRAEPGTRTVDLLRDAAGAWALAAATPSNEKNPARCGPFKAAFDRRFTLVFGTRGSDAENAWMRTKARFDAEQWLYRGNGDTRVMSDTDFLATSGGGDLNVIVYGNAAINATWEVLLAGSPVNADSTRVTFPNATGQGTTEPAQANAAMIVVRPRPGSDVALVAGVGGVGLEGLRTVERLPYFSSGVAYPDWAVFTSDVLEKGSDAVVGAGWFDHAWN